MARNFELNFKLGAQLSGAFKAAFEGASGAVNTLQGRLASASAEAGKVGRLVTMRNEVEEASQRFKAASERVEELRRKMDALKRPTRAIKKEFSEAERAADKASNTFELQKNRLAALERQMGTAGMATAQLERRQNELTRTADRARAAQQSLQRSMAARDQAATNRNNARGQLFDVAAMGMAFAAPVKMAIDWEQRLAELNKVANLTPDGMSAIETAAKKMAVQTGVAREEIIGAYTAAAQAGFARDEWDKFAEVSAKMGVAFDVTGDEAGQMLRNWRAGMGLTMQEAELLAASANHLANNMNASASDIGQVLQRQGAVLKGAGFDAAQSAALAATMLSSGASPEIAATAVKNFSNALTSGDAATGSRRRALAMLGFDNPDALAKEMQEAPTEALMKVLKGIQGLDKYKQNSVIMELFGQESAGAITPLLANLGNLQNAFGLVGKQTDYATSLQDEFDAMGNTSLQNMRKLREATKNLGTEVGETLVPHITKLVLAATPLITKLSEWIEENPKLVGGITGAGAALVVLTGATAVAQIIWNSITGVWHTASVVIKTLTVATNAETLAKIRGTAATIGNRIATVASTAAQWALRGATMAATAAQWAFNTAFVASPVGMVVLGIGALIAVGVLLYKNWDKISAWWNEMWPKMKESLANAWQGIKNWFANFSLFDSGKAIFQTLIDGLKSMGGALVDSVSGVFSKVRDMLPFSDAKTGPFSQLTASGAAIIETLGQGIKSVGSLPMVQPFSEAIGGVNGAIGRLSGASSGSSGGAPVTLNVTQNITLNGVGADIGNEAASGASSGIEGIIAALRAVDRREERLSYG